MKGQNWDVSAVNKESVIKRSGVTSSYVSNYLLDCSFEQALAWEIEIYIVHRKVGVSNCACLW